MWMRSAIGDAVFSCAAPRAPCRTREKPAPRCYLAGTVRLNTVYTPPQWRHNGYATAVMLAVSRAALSGQANEMVLITDRNSPERQAARLGYQLIGERAVLRFGPPTAPMPRLQTGPMARVRTTGPMPRLRG